MECLPRIQEVIVSQFPGVCERILKKYCCLLAGYTSSHHLCLDLTRGDNGVGVIRYSYLLPWFAPSNKKGM